MILVMCAAAAGFLAGTGARTVGARFAGRPPIRGTCEVACAVGAAGAALTASPATALALFALTWWCVCLSAVDLLARRLPDALTVPGALVVAGVAATAGQGRAALAGAALLAVPMLLAHLLSPRSLGAGDVKLAFGVGAVAGITGPAAWMLVALVPPLLTAAVGLVVRVRRWGSPEARPVLIPHGPSMCAVTALAVLVAA